MTSDSSVILLIADGARPDTLAAAIQRGELPALARLREEGALHTLTTVFPSVTGPAYVPFLLGMHPGAVGLPGLRWYDRTRVTCGWPAYARSYVGVDMRHVNRDLDASRQTMFELVQPSLGALSVITRGLPEVNRCERGLAFLMRTALTHFRGNVRGWLDIDREIGEALIYRIERERPRYTFAAFTGIDKASHANGYTSSNVGEAMQIVDTVVEGIRDSAERRGAWDSTHLWIASDHGHSSVTAHEDLAGLIRTLGYRVLAHPWVATYAPHVAVMVSGNAMAHVYIDLNVRTRRFWYAARARWQSLATAMLARESVDVMILPTAPDACEIHTRDRGMATLTWTSNMYTYEPRSGDPLGIGPLTNVSESVAYDATIASDYPDALVQIAKICASPRSGDIILSASRLWDFRARYEPIPHVSSHGALHREHMLVPFLTNHPTPKVPRRTVDIMPSAARVLGVEVGKRDGVPFF